MTWPGPRSTHSSKRSAVGQQLLLRPHDPGSFATFDDFGVVRILNDVSSTRGMTTVPAN
jgi:hypothetical protein